MSVTCMTLALLGRYKEMIIVACVLFTATTLACLIDFCIGCYLYL